MTAETFLVLIGAVFLLIGVVGGGFEAKEIKVPKVGLVPRVMCSMIGVALIIIGSGLYEVSNKKSPMPDKGAPTPGGTIPKSTQPSESTAEPDPHSRFSSWMSSSAYHNEFEQQRTRRFYPSRVEGANRGGQMQFRAVFEEFPTPPFSFGSYHGVTRDFYEKKHSELTKDGYVQVSLQMFIDQSGIERYQVTWVKR
jgi:hypothetical protein